MNELLEKYIEYKKMREYIYLSVAKDSQKKRYAESFFFNSTDVYIRNQKIVKVNKVEIYDKYGKLYLEDKY